MDLVLAGLGLIALLGAGDSLVRGAVALSLRIGVSALIVSLTVVAFGTSAPELLIAIKAALAGSTGIVYGNVVGSNIANVLLVLGVPALIAPLCDRSGDGRRTFATMIGATVFFIALVLIGPLRWWGGLILLALLGGMLWDAYRCAQDSRRPCAGPDEAELAELEDVDPHMPRWRIGALIGVGLVGLPLGAHLLILGARGLAEDLGVSEAAIGLTLVAVGTSLPELATTVMAALRRQADIAMGNVIGSNIFNILGVMGVAGLFGPLAAPERFAEFDFWIMLATSLLLLPFIHWRWPISRPVGGLFVLLFIAYMLAALEPLT